MREVLKWIGTALLQYWFIVALGMAWTTLVGFLQAFAWPSALMQFGLLVSMGSIVSFLGAVVVALVKRQITSQPTRPYFTNHRSYIRHLREDQWELRVQVENNEIPVNDVASQLVMLNQSLSPTIPPIAVHIFENANPLGSRSIYFQNWWSSSGDFMLLGFVLFQMRYVSAAGESKHVYTQEFFFKIQHLSTDGTVMTELHSASMDEKSRIEKYMKLHEIPPP